MITDAYQTYDLRFTEHFQDKPPFFQYLMFKVNCIDIEAAIL